MLQPSGETLSRALAKWAAEVPTTPQMTDPTAELVDKLIRVYEGLAAHHRREVQRIEGLLEGLRASKPLVEKGSP